MAVLDDSGRSAVNTHTSMEWFGLFQAQPKWISKLMNSMSERIWIFFTYDIEENVSFNKLH